MHQTPVVAITGHPSWSEEAAVLLRELGFQRVDILERDKYVSRLADSLAAMVLVDGDEADWQFWAVTPKVTQATRRIPVIVVADDDSVLEAARRCGADGTFPPDRLRDDLPDYLDDFARVRSEEDRAHLLEQCAEPLPPLALEGIQRFNAGEYYAQHDLFEEQWFAESGPVRDLYQGILQVGVAYYQITRGNYRGALKMLLRSTQWLLALPDECQGVDVGQLREDSMRVRAELESMAPDQITKFDRGLLKPVRVVSQEGA